MPLPRDVAHHEQPARSSHVEQPMINAAVRSIQRKREPQTDAESAARRNDDAHFAVRAPLTLAVAAYARIVRNPAQLAMRTRTPRQAKILLHVDVAATGNCNAAAIGDNGTWCGRRAVHAVRSACESSQKFAARSVPHARDERLIFDDALTCGADYPRAHRGHRQWRCRCDRRSHVWAARMKANDPMKARRLWSGWIPSRVCPRRDSR
jgi:hypothetical protein